MSKETHTYKAEYSIRAGSNVYRPGEPIPDEALTDKDIETFLDSQKISKIKSDSTPPKDQDKKKSAVKKSDPKADSAEPTGEDTKATGEEKVTKESLMAENKPYTEAKVKELGLPEEEWKDLNKEPLIDYYLKALEDVAAPE